MVIIIIIIRDVRETSYLLTVLSGFLLLLLLLFFWPRYSIPEEWKNYAMQYKKVQKNKLEWTLLLLLLHKTVMQLDGIVPLNQNGESLK